MQAITFCPMVEKKLEKKHFSHLFYGIPRYERESNWNLSENDFCVKNEYNELVTVFSFVFKTKYCMIIRKKPLKKGEKRKL
jgi:hypothetical protein